MELTRRDMMGSMLAAAGVLSARAAFADSPDHQWMPPARPDIFHFDSNGQIVLSEQAMRAIDVAVEFGIRIENKENGMVGNEGNTTATNGRQSYLCALAFICTDDPKLVARGRMILEHFGATGAHWAVVAGLLALDVAQPLFSEKELSNFREGNKSTGGGGEMIIAGRNINIPMGSWMGWIVGAVLNNNEEHILKGIEALEQFTDLVAPHGEIPEYNSSTYHPMTLMYLRAICLANEPRTKKLASALEEHLWANLAWRWHPRLRQPCGPWGRAYHDSLIGGSGMTHLLGVAAWNGFYETEPGYRTFHAHDNPFGSILMLLAKSLPFDTTEIAMNKPLPITVVSRAEQAVVQMGKEPQVACVPGGIAELTTWMDENLAVGSASRHHLHGMQSGTYVAQWTRTGEPVEKINDLGQAFTHFTQNGRRPCQEKPLIYRNHHFGNDLVTDKRQWADDGRHSSLQSGPTTLTTYIPKEQERWQVQRLEMFMVFPRLDTTDDVLVDGKPVNLPYKGSPKGAVAVLSGKAVMGMRFAPCQWIDWHEPNPEMTPQLIIEEANDHLLVGLRLVDFDEERELPELIYRRYAASIGSTLAFVPNRSDLDAFLETLRDSTINDIWNMGGMGGHRTLRYRFGDTELSGRYEPISESWLRRRIPRPAGAYHITEWGKNAKV